MTKSNPLDKARKLAQEMIEARDSAESGEWEFLDGDGNQFVIAVKRKSKNGPEHDKIKRICALPAFVYRTQDFKFIAYSANTAKPLAEMTLRLIRALELCKEQRDDFLKRELQSTYIDEAIPDIMKKVYAYLNAEIQAVLEGEK